ncbi:LysR family transcriptional regulator [Nocardiopsis mangrovi]|uniref:LysR family transcriptional regulator n=1 Tax=Nocardiopsis mangrovi TaxID=1179818 RepID=A0ABV9DXT9_9ACTN
MPLTPPALTYFREVARTGSITEAAAAHLIAPSAISRQIAKLEAEIGVALFERHTRGMTLTEAGHRLLVHVRRNEMETSVLLAEMRGIDTAEPRTITVACTEGFAYRVVPHAMAKLRGTHSTIGFRLDVVGREEATRRVAEGSADIGATYAIGDQSTVRVEYSAVMPVYAVVPPGHPLAERPHVGLAELCGYPLALSAEGASQRELFDAATRIERLDFHTVLECDRAAAVYEFARSGGGVAITSELGARNRPIEGVVHVRLDHPIFEQRRAQIQTMIGRRHDPRIPDFVNALIAELPPAHSPSTASTPRLQRQEPRP